MQTKSNPRVLKFLRGAAMLVALSPAALSADDAPGLQITTGHQDGGYHRIGENLSRELARQGMVVGVRSSAGSMANLTALSDPASPVAIALAQADALYAFSRENPVATPQIMKIDDWGMECAFVVVSADSSIRTGDDLQAQEGLRMAISSPESGAAVTLSYMTVLEPGLKSLVPVYMPTDEALEQLRLPASGRSVDAVMFVQHPKARPAEMRMTLDNLDAYRFVVIDDRDLDDRLPGGQKGYTRETFTPVPLVPIEVRTICTQRLILANTDKLSEADLSVLTTTVENSKWDLYRLGEQE